MTSLETSPQLNKEITFRQLFTLAFGSIIGVGWIIVLGNWLMIAGSIGAILGFLGGGLMVVLIGLCYGEAAAMFPVAGGEVAYAYEMYGTRMSFIAGWFLALSYIAVLPFEAISVGWILEALIPGIEGPHFYTVLGDQVHVGSLAAGLLLMGLISYINFRGVRAAVRFQEILTFALLTISIMFILAGLIQGDITNLKPTFIADERGSIWFGIFAIMGTVPFWFAGFDVIPQAMGEKAVSVPVHLIGRVITLSIIAAFIFYGLIILSSSMAMPRQQLLALELPAAGAFEAVFQSSNAGKMVLIAGLFGLITSWNAIFFAVSRVIYSLGRARMIPVVFGTLHPSHKTPAFTIVFVCLVGTLGTLLGRGAILPIVNSAGATFGFVFFLICIGIIRLRCIAADRPRPYQAPGGMITVIFATFAALAMTILALNEIRLSAEGSFPLPMEWCVIIAWLALGSVLWHMERNTRSTISEAERRLLIFADDPLQP